VQTYLTTKYVFDLRDEDIYWCTADIGWVTGHSYVVYGPLQNGATVLMYEGAPNWPDFSRFWKIIDDHKVTIFYTAPTAIRAFIKWGDQHVEKTSSTRCACSAPSASPSIPKRGCGTARRSATTAAPSSIPGGRPRPAPS
jgi:acyl-coenzyme A synthetase/AMP-(fatty) acid ligase